MQTGGLWARAALLIRRFRVPEVTLMTGFAVIGGIAALDQVDKPNLARFASVVVAVQLHFFCIYSFNSFLGFIEDHSNDRLAPFLPEQRRVYLWAAAMSGVPALILYGDVAAWLVPAAVISIALWYLYSVPGVGLKSTPFAGTALHVGSGALHFGMGWQAAEAPVASTWWAGAAIGLMFAGGHLVHELIDEDADRAGGLRTAAATFGSTLVWRCACLVVLASLGLWAFLLAGSRAPQVLVLPFLVSTAAHGVLALIVGARGAPSRLALLRYRSSYRALHLCAGIVTLGWTALRLTM